MMYMYYHLICYVTTV